LLSGELLSIFRNFSPFDPEEEKEDFDEHECNPNKHPISIEVQNPN
jgi:hypothetical protein